MSGNACQLLASAIMLRRLAPLLLLATACNSSHSLNVDGKTVTLGASAAVSDCPKCPASAAPRAASAIKWSFYPNGEKLQGPLLSGGGTIDPDEPGWACTYTAPYRLGDQETVELDCEFGKAHVEVIAMCRLRRGEHDSQALHLGKRGMVLVACEAS
jgi:hypothetical protein